MTKRTAILILLAILLFCLLPVMVLSLRAEKPDASVSVADKLPILPSLLPEQPEAASALAELIQPDQTLYPEVVVPSDSSFPTPEPEPIVVSAGSMLYAYEGMAVRNDGGTVYSTGAMVTNVGGTVFCNGGTVYNYGGVVYAKAGTVFSSSGTVYNDGADIILLPGDDSQESRIYGYYELRLADYYEPYVTLEGVVNEPGSEMMIISEDSVCRVTPKDGYRIADAESESGDLVWDADDGSVSLINVTGNTTLKLKIDPVRP